MPGGAESSILRASVHYHRFLSETCPLRRTAAKGGVVKIGEGQTSLAGVDSKVGSLRVAASGASMERHGRGERRSSNMRSARRGKVQDDAGGRADSKPERPEQPGRYSQVNAP